MNTKPSIHTQTTREYVYNLLRNQILEMELEPGVSLSEKEISEKLQVSRTPVREAFIKLSQEGLLEIYPQKGTFVSLIDLGLVEEARFMREQLEIAVVRLACEHFPEEHLISLESNLKMQKVCSEQKDYQQLFELDEDFHRTIFQGCNKERIWLAMQPMNTHFNRTRILRLASNYNWDDILSQHTEIVHAIKEQTPEKAVHVMKKHLMMVEFDKKELQRFNPRYFK
ncbi:GntR family transcriptional regulator [Bacillus ginsengihumi]|uniref:GntR family transcriptional regulator n=1 Tax=Heyndrickxia ginsengihumi TaxID=363870 RepID=A0A0A6VDC0_9BACI|nr:GntR family transcriptional regulator [Heyndrickxia ginsengihumi]KHD85581.1 GntR family transcriptional regulator [Heyndrickxia ginsengihumi]MBE6183640.1 GntR family transcriptional regulator [Bacillus sp. (in: firmicutes)]MCM3023081.1 GntR family transcriptional regulator [Heyndrickxia ginsengihumi]NEY19551.1 GntR family transcriptional regulator [Heyndrickxia ginsengihumi]